MYMKRTPVTSFAAALLALTDFSRAEESLQQRLGTTVQTFAEQYKSASNDIKKSQLRQGRKDAIAALFPNLVVTNWTGSLKSLRTDSEGNASIVVQLDDASATVKTMSTAAFDTASTMIKKGSAIYEKIANLNVGEKVVFSGAFIAGDKDHLKEMSITEAGSMSAPDFLFRFSDIRALK